MTSSDLEFFADLWAAMPRKGKLRRDRGHLSFAHFKWFLFRLGIPLGFDPVLCVPLRLAAPTMACTPSHANSSVCVCVSACVCVSVCLCVCVSAGTAQHTAWSSWVLST